MSQGRAWVFTLNNPTSDELPLHPKERYVIYQRERGENGTPHLQGYIELTTNSKLGGMKKWLPGAHFELRRGTRDQARAYCRKEETAEAGPWERGDFDQGGQGKRNDLADAVNALKEGGMRQVAEEHPTAFVKFSRGLRELQRELKEKPRDLGFEPRNWQAHVLDWLSQEPDDRTILWVTDTTGGHGKSRLARYLCMEHGAVQLAGRLLDMSYIYNEEKLVIFDITRAAVEHSDHLYTMAENLKNGVLVCGKYEACTKYFNPPHIVFFANFSWDRSKWTNDRVVEVDLNNPDVHV